MRMLNVLLTVTFLLCSSSQTACRVLCIFLIGQHANLSTISFNAADEAKELEERAGTDKILFSLFRAMMPRTVGVLGYSTRIVYVRVVVRRTRAFVFHIYCLFFSASYGRCA